MVRVSNSNSQFFLGILPYGILDLSASCWVRMIGNDLEGNTSARVGYLTVVVQIGYNIGVVPLQTSGRLQVPRTVSPSIRTVLQIHSSDELYLQNEAWQECEQRHC